MLSLTENLRTKLIPWSQQDASERFIIARHKMRQADMPYGVQLIPHQIQSKRIIVKNKRSYNNVRNIIARWPDDSLHELGKYVLVCVLGGSIDYTLGNYKIRCGPGHFIFIPPGIPHPEGSRTYVDLEKSTSCDIITFLLHPSALECWMSHGYDRGREQNNNCLMLHEHAVALLHALTDEVINEKQQSPLTSEKLLNVFLEIFLREIEAGRFQTVRSTLQAEQKITTAAPADFLTHLEHYVQANLQNHLTLNTISAELFYSSAQFTRIIRRELGKSFNEYLAEQRVAEAKDLLRKTDWTVTAVSSLVGIKSHRYFRTLFKRHTGLTPTEFRLQETQNCKVDRIKNTVDG